MTQLDITDLSSIEIFKKVLAQFSSAKAFSRAIGEDGSDILRWKNGRGAIKARAVVAICKLYPEIPPYRLNDNIFPKGLMFTFGE